MTAKDNLIHYMNKLNYSFTKLTNDYNYISSNITKLLNNDVIPYEHLTDLDISMNDLSINIQTILIIIENTKNTENIENIDNTRELEGLKPSQRELEGFDPSELEYEKQKKTDLLVKNTLTRMLPIFLLYLMLYDNESILNSKTFGKNNDETLNGIPNLNIIPELNYDVYNPELD